MKADGFVNFGAGSVAFSSAIGLGLLLSNAIETAERPAGKCGLRRLDAIAHLRDEQVFALTRSGALFIPLGGAAQRRRESVGLSSARIHTVHLATTAVSNASITDQTRADGHDGLLERC